MFKALYLITTLLSIASISHANLLKSGFKIEYNVNYNGMEVGVSKRSLLFISDENAIYKAETVPEGFASLFIKETVKEISNSKITRKRITPIQYVITKNKSGKIEENKIDFNWNEKILTNSYSKKPETLKENSYDLLSLQLSIMRDLQQHRRAMRYKIATKKHYRLYNLKIEKEEVINTPMGEFKTTKLVSNSPEGNSTFTFWCAQALEYLPVKIQKINDKGDIVDFTLRTFAIQK